MFWGFSSTAWSAFYTVLTLFLLLTAWGTLWVAWGQWREARRSAEDARRAQLETLRPYVLVTAEPNPASRKLFDLSVRNIGARPAIRVRLAFDPEPVRASEVMGHKFADMKIITEGVALLAPGQDVRAYWDSHLDRGQSEDLPKQHTVTVTYEDTSGVKYEECSVVDLDAMRGAAYVEVKSLHDVGKTLETIGKRLERAEVLSRSPSLQVEAVTEDRVSHEKRVALEDYQRRMDRLAALENWRDERPEIVQEAEESVQRWLSEHPNLAPEAGDSSS